MELIEKTISLYKNIQDVFNKLSLDDKKEDEEKQAQLTLLNNALQSIYNDFLEKNVDIVVPVINKSKEKATEKLMYKLGEILWKK